MKYLIALLVLSLLSVHQIYGQSIQYPLVRVGPQQGFYSKYVHTITEDYEGRMLFGAFGPDVFIHDGVSFISIEGFELGGDQSFEIFRDEKKLLLTSGEKLFGIEPNKKEIYEITNSNRRIRVHPQSDKKSYISMGSTFYSLDSNDSLSFLFELIEGNIKQVLKLADHKFIFLTESGDVFSSGESPETAPQKLSITGVKVLLRNGSGIYAINEHCNLLFEENGDLVIQNISNKIFSEVGAWTFGKDEAWFYADNTLYKLFGKSLEEVPLMAMAETLDIAALYVSTEGTLWIGTYGQGLYKLYDLSIKTFVNDGTSLGNIISLFTISPTHGVMAGTSKGLFQIKDDQVTKLDLPNFSIFSAARYSDNEIILGGKGFLMMINLDTGQKSILRHEVLNNSELFSILKKDNSLLIASGSGLLKFDSQFRFKGEIKTEGGSSITSITHLENINKEVTLIVDNAKPYLIQDNSVIDLNLDKELESVFSVYQDGTQSIWLGSFRGTATQIGLIDNNIKQSVLSQRSRKIYSIFINENSEILLGTEKGIELYSSNGNLFYDDRVTHLESNLNTLIPDPYSDGYLLGTVDGLFQIDGAYKAKARRKPRLLELKVNGEPLKLNSQNLKLPYNKNNLIFNVGIHDFVNSTESKLRFRLKGYTDQWVEVENGKGVQFTNLPPGKFQIEVESLHFQGDRHLYILPFYLEVEKPFWRETWYYIVSTLLGVSVIIFGYYWLERKNINKNRKLSQIISERTHEIQKINEGLEKKVISRTSELYGKNKELKFNIRQKEKFESLVRLISSNSQDIFCLLDESKKIVIISESAATTIGKSPAVLIGTNVIHLLEEKVFQEELRSYLDLVDLDKQIPLIVTTQAIGEQNVTLEIKAKKIDSDREYVGKGFVLNLRNVTDRENLKREIGSIYKNIHRDFHDEVGNKLARIIALISVLKLHSENSNNDKGTVDKIENAAKGLYRDTRDFIWSLDQDNNTLEELCLQLRDFGESLFDGSEVNFRCSLKIENNQVLAPNMVRDLLLIFKEIMTNVLKHSLATDCYLKIFQHRDNLLFMVYDNGIGITSLKSKGNGLKNIKFRSERSGGSLFFKVGRGTMIGLRIKT